MPIANAFYGVSSSTRKRLLLTIWKVSSGYANISLRFLVSYATDYGDYHKLLHDIKCNIVSFTKLRQWMNILRRIHRPMLARNYKR